MAARLVAALFGLVLLVSADTAVPPIWPQLQGMFPGGGRRGTDVHVTLKGRNLQAANAIVFRSGKLKGRVTSATPYEVKAVISVTGDNAWDHHGTIFPAYANEFMSELDQAFSALLTDLDDRGMLDTTLVLMTGEFGRTAEINVNNGRDHWPNCFSLVLAGAGVPKGQIVGESDSDGMSVKDRPVEVPDLMATILKKCGISFEKEYVSNIGRPIKIAEGHPLNFLG